MMLAIKDITPEQKAALHRAAAKQIGALTPKITPVNLRVRVQWFDENCAALGGGPTCMLNDSSGGVIALLTTPEQVAMAKAVAPWQASVIVHNADVILQNKHLMIRMG